MDADRLRLPDSEWKRPAKSKRLPRHRPGEEFLKGPIPLAWLRRACELRGKAVAVALSLWYKAGMCKGNDPVKVTSRLLERFGVNRKAGYRGLAALVSAGLVSVERHPGRCPRARILDPADESD